MITKELKATAIAKIKCHVPLEEIALELDIPFPLVKEWHAKETESESNRTASDLVNTAAKVHAVQVLTRELHQQVIPPSNQQEELLKLKIEEVALEIAEQVSLNLATTDVIRAKTLQLCADTVTKLYNSLISKAIAPDGSIRPSDTGLSAFRNVMRD